MTACTVIIRSERGGGSKFAGLLRNNSKEEQKQQALLDHLAQNYRSR